jgi:hypothetical protein
MAVRMAMGVPMPMIALILGAVVMSVRRVIMVVVIMIVVRGMVVGVRHGAYVSPRADGINAL